MSTRCLWRLGPWSEGQHGRPAVLGDCGPGPKALGVDQVSRATCAGVQGPSGTTSTSRRLALGSGGLRIQPSLPCESRSGSDVPCIQTALRCDSCPCPKALVVDHLSHVTLARVQGPSVSTSSPGQLGPGSEDPWVQRDFPGDSGPGVRVSRVYKMSRATRALARGPAWSGSSSGPLALMSEGPQIPPAVPGHSGSGPRARRVDQSSWVTRANT